MKLGDTEEWTILNKDSQYHDFHIHQTGFLVTEVNGAPTDFDGLRDTFSVPPARNGKPGEAKLIIPFTNPEIVGRFVFHCHVVKHEDKGMMMAVEVVRSYIRLTTMSTSIRNRLPGVIEKIVSDKVVSEVVIRTAAGTVTVDYRNRSVKRMNLKQGDTVFAIIKATEVSVEKQ